MAAAPDFPFDPELLRHVSPIEWKNAIRYGEIKILPAKLKMRGPWGAFLHESGRYTLCYAENRWATKPFRRPAFEPEDLPEKTPPANPTPRVSTTPTTDGPKRNDASSNTTHGRRRRFCRQKPSATSWRPRTTSSVCVSPAPGRGAMPPPYNAES